MKILFVSNNSKGHNFLYMNNLAKIGESVFVLEEIDDSINGKVYPSHYTNNSRTFLKYCKWIKFIADVCKKEKPDIIHFIVGDDLYRYFGFGLSIFKRYHSTITFHNILHTPLRDFSLKLIARKIDKIFVHSPFELKQLIEMGIDKGVCANYPCFRKKTDMSIIQCRKKYKISSEYPVLGVFGATRYGKGLDILLEALNTVEKKFTLMICGVPTDFNKEFIVNKIKNYSERVVLNLRLIPDDEYAELFNCIDFLVIPYRKHFQGSSGTMTEAIGLGKSVIASRIGTLGEETIKYHLGYTFIPEDAYDLSTVISKAISEGFTPNERTVEYSDLITPQHFLEVHKATYMELIKNV